MALVDKHVADEAAGGAECRPTATAGVGVIVGALPRELGAGGAITGAVPHVEVRFDGSEDHLAVVLPDERDVRRLKKVKVFPLVHLGDPPPRPAKARAKAGVRFAIPTSQQRAWAGGSDCRPPAPAGRRLRPAC